MLMVGSKIIGMSVMSLHVGAQIATIKRCIVDPENLNIIAFEVDGPLINDPEVGNYLMSIDVREVSLRGFIIDSTDILVKSEEVIRLDEVLKLNFDLLNLKVVAKEGKRLNKVGKVADFTVDSKTLSVFQIITQRPLISSFIDPLLTINRSQIIEIDDYKITIRHEKQKVKVKEKEILPSTEEFVPSFTNPFRKPNYSPIEDEDSSSKMSE